MTDIDSRLLSALADRYRDGQSFIMVQLKSSSDQTVVVLLNWFDQHKRP